MSGRATEQTLSMLHELTAQALIERIKSGEATSADLNAAIKFLKDNDISCVVTQSDPMKELIDGLVDYDETVFTNSDDEVVLRAH